MAVTGLPAERMFPVLDRLAARISNQLFTRGRSYKRMVPRDLEVDDGLLVCEVQGSAREPYEVTIDFDDPSAWCTCPYSSESDPCKHVAAVVEVLRETVGRPGPAPTPATDPLTSSVVRVEQALERLELERVPRERGTQALSWEVQLAGERVEVHPVVRRRLKSGALGAPRRLHLGDLSRRPELVLDPRDQKIAALVKSSYSYSYSYNWTQPIPLLYLLELLEGHPEVHVAGRGGPVPLSRASVGLVVTANDDGSYRVAPALDGRPLVPGNGSSAIGMECVVSFDASELRLRFGTCSTALASLLGALSSVPRNVPKETMLALLDKVAARAPSLPAILPRELEGEPVAADPRVVLRLTPTESGGAALEVRTRPIPDGPALEPGQAPERLVATTGGRRLVTSRDLPAEIERARQVAKALSIEPDESLGWTALLERDDDVLDLLTRLERTRLEDGVPLPAPVVVEWPEDEHARRVVTPPSTAFKIGLDARHDWFGVEGGLEVEGELVALGVLLSAAREGRRYVEVGKGRFVELAKVFGGKLDELSLIARENRGRVELPRASAPVATGLLSDLELTKAPASWHALARRVRELPSFEPEPPAELLAELRPYQLEGYRWLRRLAELGIGGCLADDMGLGKTVQAIAALLDRREEGPALVVAPTSVGFNWARELERFAPGLRPRSFRTEDRRALVENAGKGDVVVASYGLLRLEAEALSKVEWGTLVLDEAQAIKNAATDTARSARGLNAKWTIALTGTPVENHLGELWSLFQTIAPGLLGSWEQFATRFAGPIEREKNVARRKALARIVRPFMLRRVKTEVLKELPPRTEVRLDVVLSKSERALYEKARLQALARLTSPAPGKDQRFEVLAELTKLRQLACHARLVEPRAPRVSAKLALLQEQLDEILEGGHRALVFSQFTRHLDLVGEALEERGIETLRLDGKTPPKERERLVDSFQRGEAPVFLISLKAGGSGLNLTAADYVFHLDPWWNPAVEDQAADRAHRIGQDRAVTVVRLVARDTIEEKVLALHADKRDLVAGILDGTDRAAKLTTADLIALLKTGARETADIEIADDAAPEPTSRGRSPAPPARRQAVPAQLLERFREHVQGQGAMRTTAATYARELRAHLGSVLDPEDARPFEGRLMKRLSALEGELAPYGLGTRKVKATALSRFLEFAAEKGLLAGQSLERARGLVAALRC